MKTLLLSLTTVLLATTTALALTPAQVDKIAEQCAQDIPFSNTIVEDLQECVDFNTAIYPRYVSFKPEAYKGR